MSDDWRDHEPGRAGLSVAGLGDGESMTARVLSEPFRRDTDESDDALHVPVQVVDSPDHLNDMSGESITQEKEYNIINSSSAFFNALVDAFPEGTEMAGETVEITARQPGDNFSRFYEIQAE